MVTPNVHEIATETLLPNWKHGDKLSNGLIGHETNGVFSHIHSLK